MKSHTATACLVVSLGLLPCCGPARAQAAAEDPGGNDGPQLETVTVSARRSIEQRFAATGSLVVVDRKDIEALGAFSVVDVLRQLPSVQVTPSADGGVEIRMRGMDPGATQLLIDGQRVSSGKSQLPLDQMPAEMIERIEVVRAPSAEFSGAIGGTLNIVLRAATVKRETNLRLTDNHVWGRNAGQVFFSHSGPLGGAQAAAPVLERRKPVQASARAAGETSADLAARADAAPEAGGSQPGPGARTDPPPFGARQGSCRLSHAAFG